MALCRAGPPLLVGVIAAVGIAGALGGLAVAMLAAVALLLVRRARAQRRADPAAVDDRCAPAAATRSARERERVR